MFKLIPEAAHWANDADLARKDRCPRCYEPYHHCSCNDDTKHIDTEGKWY